MKAYVMLKTGSQIIGMIDEDEDIVEIRNSLYDDFKFVTIGNLIVNSDMIVSVEFDDKELK